MNERIVYPCFGHYGEKEDKNCRNDCNSCPEFKERRDIIFCKRKKTYPCWNMCKDTKLCSNCYWEWYEKRKSERISLRDVIKKYIHKYKLKIRKYSDRKKQ